MRPRHVVGSILFTTVCALYAAAASALPPSETDVTRCKPGDTKIGGLCYESCGVNVVASDRRFCVSACPKTRYQAGPNNTCQECETTIRTVSVTNDCGTGKPCGNCDVGAGGKLYYCPIRNETHWCCTFPPKQEQRKNSKGAWFSAWRMPKQPDYANGVAGPNVYERCASWSPPLIRRKTYEPIPVGR